MHKSILASQGKNTLESPYYLKQSNSQQRVPFMGSVFSSSDSLDSLLSDQKDEVKYQSDIESFFIIDAPVPKSRFAVEKNSKLKHEKRRSMRGDSLSHIPDDLTHKPIKSSIFDTHHQKEANLIQNFFGVDSLDSPMVVRKNRRRHRIRQVSTQYNLQTFTDWAESVLGVGWFD